MFRHKGHYTNLIACGVYIIMKFAISNAAKVWLHLVLGLMIAGEIAFIIAVRLGCVVGRTNGDSHRQSRAAT